MSNPAQNNVKLHTQHGWEKQSVDHINNVSLKSTHSLMKCSCGWYGWVKDTILSESILSP
jgi:hypothetical protein